MARMYLHSPAEAFEKCFTRACRHKFAAQTTFAHCGGVARAKIRRVLRSINCFQLRICIAATIAAVVAAAAAAAAAAAGQAEQPKQRRAAAAATLAAIGGDRRRRLRNTPLIMFVLA